MAMIPRSSFIKTSATDAYVVHEAVFAVTQRNMDLLEAIVLERSTKGNNNLQAWMTYDEIGQLTSNRDSANFVIEWLQDHDVEVGLLF